MRSFTVITLYLVLLHIALVWDLARELGFAWIPQHLHLTIRLAQEQDMLTPLSHQVTLDIQKTKMSAKVRRLYKAQQSALLQAHWLLVFTSLKYQMRYLRVPSCGMYIPLLTIQLEK